MNHVGRKIYYDKTNGAILWDTGERMGDVHETTFEEDARVNPSIVNDNIGVISLEYGYKSEEFADCKSYTIDPHTEEINFIFDEE